jgi:DNA-binding NtrC family response regulator
MDDRIPLLLVVAEGSEALAVSAFRAGITDYFHALRDETILLDTLRRWLACSARGALAADSLKQQEKSFFFLGSNAIVMDLKTRVMRIAESRSNVLITGETGTGKELVASAVHHASTRSNMPFVRINCAAIPDSLAESELFGYERGAFTGAHLRNQGRLETAHKGTLFLDEVGDLSPGTQAKLLRAIENKEFCRLGGNIEIKVDVRFVAATNRNLEEMVAEGRFREDLYYRLNVACIHLPPLRDRKEDIPILIRHFVQQLSQSGEKRIPEISDEVWRCLLNYRWPGNIRELKNVLESALVNSSGRYISISDLPDKFRRNSGNASVSSEHQELLAALLENKWNKSRAAEQLSWSRMTLYRKMRKYRISSCVSPLGRQRESD